MVTLVFIIIVSILTYVIRILICSSQEGSLYTSGPCILRHTADGPSHLLASPPDLAPHPWASAGMLLASRYAEYLSSGPRGQAPPCQLFAAISSMLKREGPVQLKIKDNYKRTEVALGKTEL